MRPIFLSAILVATALFVTACDEHKNAQGSSSEGASSSTHSSPTLPSDESEICTKLSRGQDELSSLIQQINAVSNPIRHIDLMQQINNKRQDIMQYKRNAYASVITMRGWIGTITSMPAGSDNRGPNVGIIIAIPCPSSVKVGVSFDFSDIQVPGWGGLLPAESPLSQWRSTLEDLSVGDIVVFDARHVPSNFESESNDDPTMSFVGPLISLHKWSPSESRPTPSMLARAVGSNKTDAVARLLSQRGASAGSSNVPLLYIATQYGNKRVVDLLLASGANPNIIGAGGVTALHIATLLRRADIAGALIAHGANIDARTNDAYTQSDRASFAAFAKATRREIIVMQGTALDMAVGNDDKEMIDLLLAHHANPSLTDSSGSPALHIAAAAGHLDIVETLIRAGADVNAKDSDGRSPTDVAVQGKHPDVIAFLKTHGGKTFVMATVPDFDKAMISANLAHGAELSQHCAMCHNLTKGGTIKIGPPLYGIVGAPVATSPNFSYSVALKAKKGIWDDQTLFQYLMSPQTSVPGTKMVFAGFLNAQDAIDLIAYMKTWK